MTTAIRQQVVGSVELYASQGKITEQQKEALLATLEAKSDEWLLKRKGDFRNHGLTVGTIAEATRGYHKIPSADTGSFF